MKYIHQKQKNEIFKNGIVQKINGSIIDFSEGHYEVNIPTLKDDNSLESLDKRDCLKVIENLKQQLEEKNNLIEEERENYKLREAEMEKRNNRLENDNRNLLEEKKKLHKELEEKKNDIDKIKEKNDLAQKKYFDLQKEYKDYRLKFEGALNQFYKLGKEKDKYKEQLKMLKMKKQFLKERMKNCKI